jgi:hypothetical protein
VKHLFPGAGIHYALGEEEKKHVGIITGKNIINTVAEEGFWPETEFPERLAGEGIML